MLKITSVIASWAKACTELDFDVMHQAQQIILANMVANIIEIASRPISTTTLSSGRLKKSFLKDARPTWKKEMMIMTENIRTPKGSSFVLPIG